MALGLTGCPPNPPNTASDTTPPGLLSVDIQVLPRGGTSPQQGFISLLNGNQSRTITKSEVIRLVANVGDPESWITSTGLATDSGQGSASNSPTVQNVEWNCESVPPGQITPVELATLATTPALGPITPSATASIDVMIDPFLQVTTAPNAPLGNCGSRGTTSLTGFVQLVVTNGAHLTTTSGRFLFSFQ